MAEVETIIAEGQFGEVQELTEFLLYHIATDPRGADIGRVVAVQIANKFVEVKLVEFDDGTREFRLRGV